MLSGHRGAVVRGIAGDRETPGEHSCLERIDSRAARPRGIRARSAGLTTSVTTWLASPNSTTRGLNVPALTSRAMVRKASGRSITTLPSVISGATRVLVRVRPDDEDDLPFARGLKDAQPGGVGVLEDDVDAARELRERLLLAGADVVPVADVGRHDANLGIDVARAALECAKALDDGGKLGAADHADRVRSRHRRRRACRRGTRRRRIRRSCPARFGPARAAGGRYENGMRKLWCDAPRGVLELEAVAEHEVVALASVLTEVFVELGRRLRLDVADLGAEAVADLEQPSVGAGVPRLVGDGPRCQERDFEGVSRRSGACCCRSRRHAAEARPANATSVENSRDTRVPEQSNPFHFNEL